MVWLSVGKASGADRGGWSRTLTSREARRYGPRAPTGMHTQHSTVHQSPLSHCGLERGRPMFKITPVRIAAVLSLTCGLALGRPGGAAAEVAPGDIINKTNQDKVKGLVADGVQWCINRGMEMKIVPTQKIPLPKLYQEATEKYASQVKLKDDLTLEGYVAGRPFPQVD